MELVKHFGPGGSTGSTFGDWWQVLRYNRFAVDMKYWPRGAVITFGSLLNSLVARWENFRYTAQIEQTSVPPPLFVLGVWRSGTTHLHNLLSQDDRFAFPNTYQVYNPQTFLSTESRNAPVMQRFLPATRPMDNVKWSVGEPQEDEFALAACGLSFLIGDMAFPRTGAYFRRFLTLRDATPMETDLWKSRWLWFLKKLTWKYRKPLILKSPGHTGRIKLLLELFPRAKFVHIHRNPYTVFQSSAHTVKQSMPYWMLQSYERNEDEFIQEYREIFDAFFEQRQLIPAENFCEIAFDDLERNPLGSLEQIYKNLSLPDFEHVKPALTRYIQSLDGYQRNKFPELSAILRERLAREWSRCFEAWGYPI